MASGREGLACCQCALLLIENGSDCRANIMNQGAPLATFDPGQSRIDQRRQVKTCRTQGLLPIPTNPYHPRMGRKDNH